MCVCVYPCVHACAAAAAAAACGAGRPMSVIHSLAVIQQVNLQQSSNSYCDGNLAPCVAC